MTFGLKNAPGTLQMVFEVIFAKVKWQCALVNWDEVIVFTSSFEKHFEHVATVLRLLKNSGVTVKLMKCAFFTDAVYYHCHVIKPCKHEGTTRTKDRIVCLREARTGTYMRSFLGLCNNSDASHLISP